MTESDITVGLYGIGGVYNYGCEAIIRGTEIILRKKWPDIKIKYASLRPEDDKKRLKGCNVNIIPRKISQKGTPGRLNNLLAYYTGIYLKNVYMEDITWVNECDMIFSIGGDLYTLPHNHRKRKLRQYYNPLVHFGEIIMNLNKQFIVWGASIGPFEKDCNAKKTFVNHLTKVNLITSRESETSNYLKTLGITKNVVNFPDPAFALKEQFNYEIEENAKNEIVIGLNLSPLSAAELKMDNNISFYVDIIRNLVKTYNANLILIPHVVNDFYLLDDDLRYLKLIYNNLPNDIIEKVELVENDPGYLGIRDRLNSCDILIASRMHCCVNAISLGIPTIFLSYSKKSLGMSQYIYNTDKFVFPLNKIADKSFLDLIDYTISKRYTIKKYLIKRLENIQFDINSLF